MNPPDLLLWILETGLMIVPLFFIDKISSKTNPLLGIFVINLMIDLLFFINKTSLSADIQPENFIIE